MDLKHHQKPKPVHQRYHKKAKTIIPSIQQAKTQVQKKKNQLLKYNNMTLHPIKQQNYHLSVLNESFNTTCN